MFQEFRPYDLWIGTAGSLIAAVMIWAWSKFKKKTNIIVASFGDRYTPPLARSSG